MLISVDFYYFSPTGGTKKTGEAFCKAIAYNVNGVNLGDREAVISGTPGSLAVVAMPVFGGRIPVIMEEKLAMLNGSGKNAVILAVYGNRAYDDALLEMKDILNKRGFKVVAAAGLVAQHSIITEVAAGRPDAQDIADIQAFAQKVLEKLEAGNETEVEVPGNYPYKERKPSAPAPVSDDEACIQCETCVDVCPTGAITVEGDQVVTDQEKCIFCLACTAVCPQVARDMLEPVKEKMMGFLGGLIPVHNENEYFL